MTSKPLETLLSSSFRGGIVPSARMDLIESWSGGPLSSSPGVARSRKAHIVPSNTRLEGARAHLLPPVLTGELFAQAPVDQFPGTAVESVTDSSRYFVVRIEDGNGMLGLGALLSFRSLASRNRRLMALIPPPRATCFYWDWLWGSRGRL